MPIVNGVQVYDCVHFDKHQELGEDCCLEFQCLNCNNYEQIKCETRKNCYYKQLMRIILLCQDTIGHFNVESGTNMYSAGRCITAEQILELLESEA